MSPADPPAQRYLLLQPQGIEEIDRVELRDRIRNGDVGGSTELALAGTEEWRPAASYPELARYLEIATVRPRGSAALAGTGKRRDVRPMGERVIAGLAYPFTGGEVVTLIVLAVLGALPFIGILATLASTVIMLSIIRKSADGSLKMPSMVDTSDIGEMFWTYLRVLFVTLISLAPLLVLGFYSFGAFFTGTMSGVTMLLGVVVGLAFAMVYYPACLATVAVWDHVGSALNPLYVARVIRTMGVDYFIVIGVWIAATLLTGLMKSPIISPLAAIPIVGGIFSSALSLWVLFYASHLLGYAVYRHAPELGWE